MSAVILCWEEWTPCELPVLRYWHSCYFWQVCHGDVLRLCYRVLLSRLQYPGMGKYTWGQELGSYMSQCFHLSQHNVSLREWRHLDLDPAAPANIMWLFSNVFCLVAWDKFHQSVMYLDCPSFLLEVVHQLYGTCDCLGNTPWSQMVMVHFLALWWFVPGQDPWTEAVHHVMSRVTVCSPDNSTKTEQTRRFVT